MVLNRRDFLKDIALAGAFVFINPLNLVSKTSGIKNKGRIKGIYVPGWDAVDKKSIDDLLEFKDEGINTLMVDVKNVKGNLFYSPENKIAREINAQVKTKGGHKRSLNLDYLFKQSSRKNVNLIARHAMFRDHLLYDKIKNFRLWEGKYQKWVDMMNQDVVNYNIDLLKEESGLGFNKIVLDYIRFPATGKFDDEENKCRIIDNIVKNIKKELSSNIELGVQTFGYSSWYYKRSCVGQRISTLGKYSDVIYPMLYPSHFWNGSFGFKNPEKHPYEIIKIGYKETKEKVSQNTKVIPMIQAFRYSYEKFKEQIQAVKDYNMDGFVCWNSKGNYDILRNK